MKALLVACALACTTLAAQAALITTTGLQSITFFEATGGAILPHTFTVNSSQLTTQIAGALNPANSDFLGAPREFYDVYYSDAAGVFDLAGDYISIEATFDQAFGAGGLNITAVALNRTGSAPLGASILASFVQLGSNAIAGSEVNAIDGSVITATTMGNTSGGSQRLRLTLGWENQVPEPSTALLAGLALLGVAATGQRSRAGGAPAVAMG